jgi:rare lipoprotein A
VNASRLGSIAIVASLVAGLSGCFSALRVGAPPSPARVPPKAAPVPPPPAHAQEVPDAVPRYEPRAIYGNPPFYDVFGKRYYVMASSVGYVERGVASWYGPGFHKERTSVGEPYDMYGMTAAHKSLPLPAYVRVTNLQNGRSCVVRVNDRGPFVGNRIIDLSYTAAAKLDMLRDGTAMVEVRALHPLDPASDTHLTVASVGAAPLASPPAAATPSAPAALPAPAAPAVAPLTREPMATSTTAPLASPPLAPSVVGPPAATLPAATLPAAVPTAAPPVITPAPVTSAPVRTLFVQAGAFAAPANAQRLAEQLRGAGYTQVFVRDDLVAGRRLYRVRIGPIPNVPEFDRIVATLEHVGVRDAHLALERACVTRISRSIECVSSQCTADYTLSPFIRGARSTCLVPCSPCCCSSHSLPAPSAPTFPFRRRRRSMHAPTSSSTTAPTRPSRP